MSIKIAILGAGAISDSHIQAYQKFPERCQIAALVDIYADKAQKKAERYGLQAAVFGSYEQALQEAAFDAVSICLPPFEHAPASIAMLNAGKHVLVEKPMATCLEECDAMLAAAQRSGRLLSVVAQNRYKTPLMKLKQVLDSGLLGPIRHAQVESLWWRGQSYYDLWWRGTYEKEGGGCTMNHAVHHIDLFQWMMGMPSELQAVVANINHANSEVEDFSTALLTYPDGRIGQITASLVHHGEDQRFVFQGERAAVYQPWKVFASLPMENGFPAPNPELAAELEQLYAGLPELEHGDHAGQVDNFLAAIEGQDSLLIDGQEGRKTIELVTAIYQSGHTGQRVSLPLGVDSPFYTRAGILANARHFHEKTKSVENFATDEITFGSEYKRS